MHHARTNLSDLPRVKQRYHTYTELAGGIDELELHFFKIPTAGVNHQALAEGNDAFLCSGNGALEHDKVVLDDAIVREAAHRSDGLLGSVGLCRCV